MSKKKKYIEDAEEMEAKKLALEKWEEYSDKMMELEAKATTKTFQELIAEQPKALVAYVPELDCNIKYKGLTVQDLLALDQIEDDLLKGDEMLFRMWCNGDSSVKRSMFYRLEAYIKNYILEAIIRKSPFLLPVLPKDLLEEKEDGMT